MVEVDDRFVGLLGGKVVSRFVNDLGIELDMFAAEVAGVLIDMLVAGFAAVVFVDKFDDKSVVVGFGVSVNLYLVVELADKFVVVDLIGGFVGMLVDKLVDKLVDRSVVGFVDKYVVEFGGCVDNLVVVELGDVFVGSFGVEFVDCYNAVVVVSDEIVGRFVVVVFADKFVVVAVAEPVDFVVVFVEFVLGSKMKFAD